MEMANVRDAVNAVITAIMAQKDYLTAVDARTGDGDHGLNMARGFNADGKSLRECLEDALNEGRAGAEYTKTIAARRGRAALVGPRSIGIEDPGAMSSLIMFRALCSYLRG